MDTPIDLGIKSKVLTDNPIYVKAIEDIRKEFYESWVSSDFNDVENREQLFQMKVALELITSKLDSYIQAANNEQTEITNVDEHEQWS